MKKIAKSPYLTDDLKELCSKAREEGSSVASSSSESSSLSFDDSTSEVGEDESEGEGEEDESEGEEEEDQTDGEESGCMRQYDEWNERGSRRLEVSGLQSAIESGLQCKKCESGPILYREILPSTRVCIHSHISFVRIVVNTLPYHTLKLAGEW